MHFEHLIQINAPHDSLLPLISRAQVWRGLALRAYDPASFVMGMEGCSIRNHVRDEAVEVLDRTLYYGSFEVQDRVTVDSGQYRIRVDVQGTANWPSCTAVTNIEEPEPASLFVRFTYEWDDDDPLEQALDDTARELRAQACMAVDMDTVARIREMSRQELS